MIDRLGQQPLEACFHHVKAYRDEKLLFAFHDAFAGHDLLVSGRVSEEGIQAFCTSVGVRYRREPMNKPARPEQLRHLLWALENPHKLRMNWPWWKKALFLWKR
jgi:hypothetical protein